MASGKAESRRHSQCPTTASGSRCHESLLTPLVGEQPTRPAAPCAPYRRRRRSARAACGERLVPKVPSKGMPSWWSTWWTVAVIRTTAALQADCLGCPGACSERPGGDGCARPVHHATHGHRSIPASAAASRVLARPDRCAAARASSGRAQRISGPSMRGSVAWRHEQCRVVEEEGHVAHAARHRAQQARGAPWHGRRAGRWLCSWLAVMLPPTWQRWPCSLAPAPHRPRVRRAGGAPGRCRSLSAERQ